MMEDEGGAIGLIIQDERKAEFYKKFPKTPTIGMASRPMYEDYQEVYHSIVTVTKIRNPVTGQFIKSISEDDIYIHF